MIRPWVCVGGCPHSGTTIMGRILGHHSQIQTLFENWPFARPLIDGRDVVSEAEATAVKPVILDKSPNSVLTMPEARIRRPGTKFIIMFREADECLWSLKERGFDLLAALGVYTLSYEEGLRNSSDDTIFVSMEELQLAPERVLRRVLEHINQEWEDDLLDFHTTYMPLHTFGAHEEMRTEQINKPLYVTERRAQWNEAQLDYIRRTTSEYEELLCLKSAQQTAPIINRRALLKE